MNHEGGVIISPNPFNLLFPAPHGLFANGRAEPQRFVRRRGRHDRARVPRPVERRPAWTVGHRGNQPAGSIHPIGRVP